MFSKISLIFLILQSQFLFANADACTDIYSLSPVSSNIDTIDRLKVTDSQTTRIYFVRHGQSVANIKNEMGVKLVSGIGLDVQLTETGKEQATNLGKKLVSKLSTDADYVILSSTALRAQDTAKNILDELSTTHNIERGESYFEFCEQGKGDWEGQPKDERYENAQKVWKGLSAKDKFYQVSVSGGESLMSVSDRMLDGLRQVIEKYPHKTIFITTHNMALNTLAFRLRGHVAKLSEEPKTRFPMSSLGNCDVLMIELEVGNSVENAEVKLHIQQ